MVLCRVDAPQPAGLLLLLRTPAFQLLVVGKGALATGSLIARALLLLLLLLRA